MSRVNVPTSQFHGTTFEGGPARSLTPEQELRRSVMACLLWEDSFYESGETISKRIATLVPTVAPETVAKMAIDARSQMHLRHVPLLLVREMVRHATHRPLVASTLEAIVQRPDELTEFLAIYWKDKKQPLAAQVKKGLARAFRKFNAYSLAKYNQAAPVKLRDVLFLTHARPSDVTRHGYTRELRKAGAAVELSAQERMWQQLVTNTLPTPDTWEVAISATTDKRAEWTRLVTERKLGAFALIRNLRNMTEAGVDDALIADALAHFTDASGADRILPFRFIAAANIVPRFTAELEAAMLRNLAAMPKLAGTTIVLVDVSGSMDDKLSAKSDMTRIDAGAGLAVCAREICERVRTFTFSTNLVEVPNYRGLALARAVRDSQMHGSTYLGNAVSALNAQPYDRLIVITDEQSHDRVSGPNGRGYMINVATHKPGVGYGPWLHVDGWSERVLDYIRAVEEN